MLSYLEIITIFMVFVGMFIWIFPIEYAIIFLSGLLSKRKTFPKREEKLKYGVVVCARNEENVIGNLVESIRQCNYEQEKLDIFVIAHNCIDRTAENAREKGAIVYEYNNDQEKTKGYALKKIFECIKQDYGILNYDGFHIFDADNVLDSEYFNKMNDAFLAYDRKCAITSFRNAKNFGTNTITALYGLLYITGCSIESGGRMKLNCSSRILGSGFLVSSEMVKDGWNIVILSDDTDFTAEQIIKGNKVIYCDEAMYYDEHPTTIKAMWRQRLRWAKGTLIVCKQRFKNLFQTVFKRKKRTQDGTTEKLLRGSAFDLICVILPVGLIGLLVMSIDIILKLFAPLFGVDAGVLWTNYLIIIGITTGLGFIFMFSIAIISYIFERKRIKNVSLRVKISSILLWPVFCLLLVPLQLVALFTKKFAWTPITHSNSASHATFNNIEETVNENIAVINDTSKEKNI